MAKAMTAGVVCLAALWGCGGDTEMSAYEGMTEAQKQQTIEAAEQGRRLQEQAMQMQMEQMKRLSEMAGTNPPQAPAPPQ